MEAQKSFQNDPIAKDYEKLLYPEINFDSMRSKSPAPTKTISLNDMSKKK
jgi:hypothetical protein